MALYICKLGKAGGQFRITVPKGLVKSLRLAKEEYVVLSDFVPDQIIIRRLEINGKKTTDRKNDKSG